MSDDPICAPIDGVEPIFVAAMIRQSMALRYMKAAGLTLEEATASATATWETEWESDPRPRTIELAAEAVESDLEYWGED